MTSNPSDSHSNFFSQQPNTTTELGKRSDCCTDCVVLHCCRCVRNERENQNTAGNYEASHHHHAITIIDGKKFFSFRTNTLHKITSDPLGIAEYNTFTDKHQVTYRPIAQQYKYTTMKFSSIALIGSFLMNNNVAAFTPASFATRAAPRSNARFMAMEEAPATAAAENLPIIQSRGGAPVDVRYSDFLKLVNADKIEKVTFSSDGTQLLGVDTEGVRIKIEALPNDPDLLTQLTGHKVSLY